MTIGNNLRCLRQSLGMTQEQAAERLNITRQTLSSYETNRTQPDIEMLSRIAALYQTDLDGVVYGKAGSLKNRKALYISALIVFIALAVLSLLSVGGLWTVNHSFLSPQSSVASDAGTSRSYFIPALVWVVAERALLLTALAGAVVLFVLALRCRGTVSIRQKLLCLLSFAAVLFLLPLPFLLSGPAFLISYLYVSLRAFFPFLLFFLIDLPVEELLQRKKRPAT